MFTVSFLPFRRFRAQDVSQKKHPSPSIMIRRVVSDSGRWSVAFSVKRGLSKEMKTPLQKRTSLLWKLKDLALTGCICSVVMWRKKASEP